MDVELKNVPAAAESAGADLTFELVPIAYVLVEAEEPYRILNVTNEYLRLTGWKRSELLGRGLFEVYPGQVIDGQTDSVAVNKESMQLCRRTKKPASVSVQRYDLQFQQRYWTSQNFPVLDDDDNVTSILQKVEDVTDSILCQPESAERIRQSQRLEAMGQLAGGVAHDFNNILAIIIMKCDMMLKKPSLEELSYKSFEQIKKTSERAAALTRQLLAFSRQQVLQPRPLNINNVIHDLENILSRLLTEDISLKTKMTGEIGPVLADAGQIEQIILNLIVNARDAMPKGGRITIETENVRLEKALTSAMLRAEPGEYVLLTVRDTGQGMSAETQARIFEPFFTTKGLGKGTGLGLSTVYGIISQSKGTIWVYSEEGRGTTFKIYLPITKEAVETIPSAEERTATVPSSANILVVEDQAELRELICDSLRDHGYKVFEAENGLVALEMTQERLRFDLIVTDVIMPEMSGKELGERVQQLYPETRLLYLSGYTEETLTTHGISGSHPHFLEKPFSLDTLLEKVRVVLS